MMMTDGGTSTMTMITTEMTAMETSMWMTTTTMTHHNPVLIAGIGGPAGRSAAAYFRDKGFPVIGTDIREISPPSEAFYIIPPAGDPSFPAALIEIVKRERPSLFIPTVAEDLPVVSKLKRVMEGYGCKVFISPPDAVDIANDKLKMVMVMAGHGIPVPVSFDECTAKDIILREFGLPLLSRPRFGKEKRGVTLYRSAEELFEEKRTGRIFQEFIPGEGFDVNLFIGKRGEVMAAVVLRKILLEEGVIGAPLAVEKVEREDIVRLGRKAASTLKLEGPVSIDIRLKGDGTPVLLGIDARIGRNVLHAREIMDSLATTLKKGDRICVAH